MKSIFSILLLVWLPTTALAVTGPDVVKDGDVGLSQEELQFMVTSWPPDMQQAAANDLGDRIELLSMALANKKIAAELESVAADADPADYWRLQLSIRNLKSQFVVKQYLANLDIPDMSALAAERYETQKDKYALMPEQRYSSHILLLCQPGVCDRDARRKEAKAILAELEAGADFRQLASKYTEDPMGKNSEGQFDKWLTLGQANVDPHYIGAVFDVDEVGGHSGIVDTRFGLHIVQLDDLKPAHYKSYDEVKDAIVAALRKEYVELEAKKFDTQFRMSDDAFIDGAVVEEILQPYKQAD